METQPSFSREEAVRELWRRGDLTFKLHSGQQAIYDKLSQLPPQARQIVFLCGRRFGKSFLTLVLAIEACLKTPGARILLCAPFVKQATEIAGPLMAKVTVDAPGGLIQRHRSSHRWNFANSSTLILSGLDLVAETIRGTEFDDIYLEESGSSAPDDLLYKIDSVLFPTLLKSRGRIFHVTTLSRIEDHPLHTHVMPKAEEDKALFIFPTDACPLYSAEQLEEMCAQVGGPTSMAWLREFKCVRVRDHSLVAIPEFSEEWVKEFELPAYCKTWETGDWGGVRDKTVFQLMAYDFARAKILVFDEVAQDRHTPTAVTVAAVKAMEERHKLSRLARWVDCPGQLQIDLMAAHKFPVTLPQKDVFEASINLVRTARLEIHPRCEFTLRTLRYARLNKQRTDFERTEALGHGDGIMALCYGIRHVNKANPFPPYGGKDPHTHYISRDNPHRTKSADVLRSLFKVT